MSEVETQVKQIVVDHLGIDDSKVTPESKFIDDLGADSLDTVSYTHLRAHETDSYLVCRLLLEKMPLLL